ncbi:MAG: tellurite resistance/C4-dicarboxylate transporter family protein [Verrucomicrobiae bacterium]|nr:tellurite resistance/C4-dicarboxylate transporter family protein [Verrucomicrobiae bacterium]
MRDAKPLPLSTGCLPALRRRIREGVRELLPAYFAMPMATGVISIAAHFLDLPLLAHALFWLNLVLYAALWLMTFARVRFYLQDLLADWSDHQRGVGFFTTVAATNILGSQFAIVRGDQAVGFGLWWVGLVLWSLCMYGIFTTLTVKENKPSLAEGINGGWLTAVVATQSLCVLGCAISPAFGAHRAPALFIMLILWLCGGMLYIWLISLIFYRYSFFRFPASDLNPPYWINMGAMAISTLAGTALIRNAEASELLRSLRPFLQGFTLWYWATATWWIPMLFILAVWRHGLKRFPVAYDPLFWGAVFPLGMYASSTFQLARVVELPFLIPLARGFLVVALAAWTLTFLGLLRCLMPWESPSDAGRLHKGDFS